MNNTLKPIVAEQISSIDIDLLSSLFDCAPDVAFFIKNKTGHYITVNDSLVARHGLETKQQVIRAFRVAVNTAPRPSLVLNDQDAN